MSLIVRKLGDFPDPRAEAVKQQRMEAQRAKAEAAQKKAELAALRAQRAEVLEAMLFQVAINEQNDLSERLKAANSLLDRTVPRVKAIEVTGNVEHTHQAIFSPGQYVGTLTHDEAMLEVEARLQRYDAVRQLTGPGAQDIEDAEVIDRE